GQAEKKDDAKKGEVQAVLDSILVRTPPPIVHCPDVAAKTPATAALTATQYVASAYGLPGGWLTDLPVVKEDQVSGGAAAQTVKILSETYGKTSDARIYVTGPSTFAVLGRVQDQLDIARTSETFKVTITDRSAERASLLSSFDLPLPDPLLG